MLLSASSALEWERISFEAISHQPSHRQCASSARRRLRWVLCIPRTRRSGGQFVGKSILQGDYGRGKAGVGGVGELVLVGSSLRTDWCGFRICAGFYIKCFKLVTNRISKSCSRESNLDYLWAANISLGIYATSTTFHRKLYKLVHILITWQQRWDKTTCCSAEYLWGAKTTWAAARGSFTLFSSEHLWDTTPTWLTWVSCSLCKSENYLRRLNIFKRTNKCNVWQTSTSVKDVSSPHFHPCCRG